MTTAEAVLQWARGIEPATFKETYQPDTEQRRRQYESRVADDRATAERVAANERLRQAWDAHQRDAMNWGDWSELYDACWDAIARR